MTLITSSKQNVDIERLKIEIESLGIVQNGYQSFKVIAITPQVSGTTVDVERIDQSLLTQSDINQILATIDAHTDQKRRRVIVADTPSFSNEASNKKFVDDTIADLVSSAPGTLNTLNELASALGNNPNFATDITELLSNVTTDLNGRLDAVESDVSNLQDADIILGQNASSLDGRITAIESNPPYRNLTEHNDVNVSGPVSGQVLKYNGSKWVNTTDNTFSGNYEDLQNAPFIPTTLDSLQDIVLNTSAVGQVLTYDGTNWQNQNLPTIGIVSLNSSQDTNQLLSVGTDGSDFNISTDSGVHTFNIPSAGVDKRGLVNTTAQTFSGTKTFQCDSNSDVGLIIKGSSGQTADLLQIQNNSFTHLFKINSEGSITLGSWDASTIQITKGGTGATSAQAAINNLTQVNSATNEYVLTKDTSTGNASWKPTANRITSLNTLISASQTITTGNSGSDFNISSSESTHTINLPDASATARGVITTTSQTITGTKTVQTSSATDKALIVKGSPAQTANLFEAQDSSGTSVMSIDALGNITSPTIDYLQNAGFSAPSGAVIAFAGSSAPSGWLLCDGNSVNTYSYRQLHAVISNTYGGTAYQAGITDQVGVATVFSLPDLRSRAIVGKGSTVNTTLGNSDGIVEASRSLQHSHSITVLGHYHDMSGAGSTLKTDIAHNHPAPTLTIVSDGGHDHTLSLVARSAQGNTATTTILNSYVSAGSTSYNFTNGSVSSVLGHSHAGSSVSASTLASSLATKISATGSIGKVTGGADGNIDNTYTSTNKNNHNYLILNYIIKT